MAGRSRGRGARDRSGLERAILDLFKEQPQRGFKLKEIQRELGVPHSGYRRLRELVQELVGAGRIAALPRRRFSSLAAATRLDGEVEGVGQHATHVRLDDGQRLALTDFAADRVVQGDRCRIR